MSRRHTGDGGRGGIWGEVPQARGLKNRIGKSWGVETRHWTCPGWKLLHTSTAPQTLSWKCLQHIWLIPLRVGRLKAARHSKENVTFLSDVLICIKWKQNRREVGMFFLFFNSFVQCILRQDIWSWPCLNTLYWCRTNWTNYCTNTSRFCPDIFPPSSKSQHLHWTQTHNHLHVPQLCKTSLRLPALWGNKMGKNGSFCGEIIFLPPVYLALKGSEILQWWWGGTKSHFLVWRLQLPLVSWVFLGSYGKHWGCGREGSRERIPMTRQTDTSLCLYKCVIPKIPGIPLQMGKHPSINEYLANAGKQCTPINELVLLLTLLPDLFNTLFLFFFSSIEIFIFTASSSLKAFWEGKKDKSGGLLSLYPKSLQTYKGENKVSLSTHMTHTHMNAQILAQLLTVFDLAPRDALEGAVGKPWALLCCIQAKFLVFTLLSFGILHQKLCQDWTLRLLMQSFL